MNTSNKNQKKLHIQNYKKTNKKNIKHNSDVFTANTTMRSGLFAQLATDKLTSSIGILYTYLNCFRTYFVLIYKFSYSTVDLVLAFPFLTDGNCFFFLFPLSTFVLFSHCFILGLCLQLSAALAW